MHDFFRVTKLNSLLNTILPYSLVLGLALVILGLYQGLFIAPADYQQGEIFRIIYIHVPSAWMALGIYTSMAICSLSYIIWRNNAVAILTESMSIPGAVFALITLVTGSIWGKPIWGTWWVWDARLTSMLILFLLYMGYIVLVNSHQNADFKRKTGSILCLVGFVNIPIIKFSVEFWNSLHQKASIIRLGKPAIHSSMLTPLLLTIFGFMLFATSVIILRYKTNILKNKIRRIENRIIQGDSNGVRSH